MRRFKHPTRPEMPLRLWRQTGPVGVPSLAVVLSNGKRNPRPLPVHWHDQSGSVPVRTTRATRLDAGLIHLTRIISAQKEPVAVRFPSLDLRVCNGINGPLKVFSAFGAELLAPRQLSNNQIVMP